MLRDPDDAEEAVQEAFERAWRQRASCRNAEAPLGWLVQITRNEALRLWASRRRRREAERAGEAPEGMADDPRLEAVLPDLSVEDTLAALRPEDRAIVRLRYLSDVPQAAVAAALGMPEMTVGVRLHRARKRLRTTLQGDAPSPESG